VSESSITSFVVKLEHDIHTVETKAASSLAGHMINGALVLIYSEIVDMSNKMTYAVELAKNKAKSKIKIWVVDRESIDTLSCDEIRAFFKHVMLRKSLDMDYQLSFL
jgi:hypothetical protein